MRRVPSAVSGIGGENVSAKRYEGLIFSAFPFAAFVTKTFSLIEMRSSTFAILRFMWQTQKVSN